jgi:hypothetical protein
MWQILHSNPTTTEAILRAIQNSQEGLSELIARYSIKSADRTLRGHALLDDCL